MIFKGKGLPKNCCNGKLRTQNCYVVLVFVNKCIKQPPTGSDWSRDRISPPSREGGAACYQYLVVGWSRAKLSHSGTREKSQLGVRLSALNNVRIRAKMSSSCGVNAVSKYMLSFQKSNFLR